MLAEFGYEDEFKNLSFLEIFDKLPIECICGRIVENGAYMYQISCITKKDKIVIANKNPMKVVKDMFNYFVLIDGLCNYNDLTHSNYL